jgi:hypothetical protein
MSTRKILDPEFSGYSAQQVCEAIIEVRNKRRNPIFIIGYVFNKNVRNVQLSMRPIQYGILDFLQDADNMMIEKLSSKKSRVLQID